MILRFNLPNPSDPEINAKVYAEFVRMLGDITVNFSIPVGPNLVYNAQASMISIEGDNNDGERSRERVDHEIADEVAQRALGNIEPFPGESPQQFNDRDNRLRERFRKAHPEWKPEKFNTRIEGGDPDAA
jgi:hypothetical protein